MRTHHPSPAASAFSRLLPIVRISVSVLLLALLCTACDTPRSRLATAVKAENAKCPSHFEYGEITSVAMDGGDVAYQCTYDDEVMNYINMLHAAGALKDFMKGSVASIMSDEDYKQVLDLIVEAEAGLRFDIRGKGGDSSVSVTLSADDIREIVTSGTPAIDATMTMMKAMCTAANEACPVEVDAATTLVSVAIEGDSMIVYNYTGDEKILGMSVADLPVAEMKDIYRDDIKNPDGNMREVAEICASCNVGLSMIYKGSSSGKTLSITFTADELQQLIQ